jgi:hypothetical protein
VKLKHILFIDPGRRNPGEKKSVCGHGYVGLRPDPSMSIARGEITQGCGTHKVSFESFASTREGTAGRAVGLPVSG